MFLKKVTGETLIQLKNIKSLIAWEMGTLLRCKNGNLIEVLFEGGHE